MKRANPKLAPELTPTTEGHDKGLQKSVCISKPATEIAAPAVIAVRALGKRKLYIISR